jgi:tetratricopeptide (TPR) repeat protein
VTRALVALEEAMVALVSAGDVDADERRALREEARVVLEAVDHYQGLALYWWGVAMEEWFGLHAAETAAACERSIAYADRAGSVRLARTVRARLLSTYAHGLTPAAEVVEHVEATQRGVHGPLAEAWFRLVLGRVLAMQGQIERARELVRGGRQAYLDAGLYISAGGISLSEAEVEFRGGDLVAEERALREGHELLERIGDRSYFPTVALALAECLYRRGAEDAEIEALCIQAREATGAADLVNFFWLDLIAGLLHARRGEHEEAEECSRRAVALAETTDFYPARSYSGAYLAETLALAGRSGEAAEVATRSFEIFEAKGDVAGVAQFRSRLASLGVAVA